ncbi:ATP synthase F1 subunit epsilon [Segatella oris]|jgi:ATP synthase F1, epsilon subunit|uniref:ATP synthase F1 subunit epsilon n=1 Tax=Segatella oris TaxID=28135 RepID=UPI0028E6ECBE|nr:ATP synthase F1 subunit epsilon [Segatella oris]
MSHLRVVSPERVVFDGEVMCVTVPGAMGEFEILEHHAPIISSLEKGHIVYQPLDGQKETLDILGGFVEVQKDEIRICVEL